MYKGQAELRVGRGSPTPRLAYLIACIQKSANWLSSTGCGQDGHSHWLFCASQNEQQNGGYLRLYYCDIGGQWETLVGLWAGDVGRLRPREP